MKTKQKDRRYLARDSEPEDIEIVRADGEGVFASGGKRYIDLTSGWCVGNLGWGMEEIRERIRRFRGPAYVNPEFFYRPWADLAELLARVTPVPRPKSFRATGGSEAIEIALQAAATHTGRTRFLSLEDSYHGNTLGAFAIGASEYRKRLPFLPKWEKVSPPLDEKRLDRIETRLKRRDVAAFVMEPVSINLGVLVPPRPFMTELQRLCRRYGTLLIADEVACGFGRTGKLFASEHFDIEPDILCMAKAITGGYAPMGAAVMSTPVAESMEKKGTFYSTYGWHPLSVEAAIANVRFLIRHGKRLFEGVFAMSDYFRARLSEIDFRSPVALRIQGLAIALEFDRARDASKLLEGAKKRGLLLTTSDDSTVLLLPPLNVSARTARKALDVIEESAGS